MLFLALLATAAASPSDGKTMALDDWHQLTIYGVGGDPAGPVYVQVHAGDLDGDGLADDAVLKLQCDRNELRQAHYVTSPRDSGGGMPTGKRQHGSVKFVKEWGPASPQLLQVKPTYDVKQLKGNERLAADGWTEVSLANTDGLCGAAQAAIVKSKSNITNN
jgi:hypothetical protein